MVAAVGVPLAEPGIQSGLGRSEWCRTARILGRNRLVPAHAVMVVLVVLTAVLAAAIAPYDPIANNVRAALQPPSSLYFFRTDRFGRDVFSRVVLGSQLSLIVALVSVGVSASAGPWTSIFPGLATCRPSWRSIFSAIHGSPASLAKAAHYCRKSEDFGMRSVSLQGHNAIQGEFRFEA
jgi:hypothetical protein